MLEEPGTYQQIGKRGYYLDGKLITDTTIYQISADENQDESFWNKVGQQLKRISGMNSD